MQPDHHDEDAGDARDAEERAWRAIVENYGERAHLEDPPVRPPEPPGPPGPSGPPEPPGPSGREPEAPFGGRFGDPRAFDVADEPVRPVRPPRGDGAAMDHEEGFVPPEPPPVPRTSPDRLLAWAGVLGSPLLLLAALLASYTIPEWAAYLLVVGFVGGFVYLVARMPREPREPWDDGAQV